MKHSRMKYRVLSWVLTVAMFLAIAQMPLVNAIQGLGEKFTVTLVDITNNQVITDGYPISADQVVDGQIDGNLRWNGGSGLKDYAVQKVYVQEGRVSYNVDRLEYLAAQGNEEARVYLKLKDIPQDRAKLYYPVSESQKIKVAVYPVAEVARLTYKVDQTVLPSDGYDAQDIQIYGPETAQIVNGTAKANFVVSVPRKMRPKVTLEGGNNLAKAQKIEDRSVVKEDGSFSRTIWVYELTTPASATITASWEVKNQVNIKGADDKRNKYDWQQGYTNQDAYQFPDRDKLSEIQTEDGRGVESGNEVRRDYNSTVFFNIYHDKTFTDNGQRRWLSQRSGYNVFLAGVHISGQTFGAPQPFSRFGASKYKTSGIPGGESNRAYIPHYSAYPGAADNDNGTHLNVPGVIDIFAQSTGYGPWWSSGDGRRGTKRKFYDWYYNQVMYKGLQNNSALKSRYVETGPLAGSTVSVYLVDAKPAKYKGPLASIHGFDRSPTVAAEYATDYGNNQTIQRAGQNDYLGPVNNKWDAYADGSGGNKAFWNAFRTKYAVQINNVRDDIDLDTEWYTTDSTKLGLYKNEGVENVEVFAKRLEFGDGNFGGQTQWLKVKGGKGDGNRTITGEGTYLDSRAIDGTYNWNNKNKFNNTDPVLKIRGDVVNGYIDPTYVDDTAMPAMGGDDWMKPYKDSGNGGGRGFYGEYSLFATGVVNLLDNDNDVFTYGGMNISGVQAKLVPVKAGFDLQGGSITNSEKFPTVEAVSQANPEDLKARLYTLNVNSNPIVHVPQDTPVKAGSLFKGWRVYRSRGDSVYYDKTNILLQPGMDLNIDLTASERSSGFQAAADGEPATLNGVVVIDQRISDTTGRLNFDKIKLEAEWTTDASELGVPGIFRVEQSFKDEANGPAKTKPVMVFRGLPGMKADLTELALKDLAPKTITEGQGATAKTYSRVLSDEAWEAARTQSVTLTNPATPVLSIDYLLHQITDEEKFTPVGGQITLPVRTTLTADHAQRLVTFPTDQYPDNADATPTQYQYAFKADSAPAPETQTVGTTQVTVVVTYPDNTSEEVTASIQFVSQADYWKSQNGGALQTESQTLDYAQELKTPADKLSFIAAAQRTTLPQGATVDVKGVDTKTKDPANKPDGVVPKTLHQQSAEVVVTFADGSRLSAPVIVNVRTAAETFKPTAKQNSLSFYLGERLEEIVAGTNPPQTRRQQATSGVVAFPKEKDGSPYVLPIHEDGYRFKDPVNTAVSNAPQGTANKIEIHYQDKSVGFVPILVLIESQSDIWKRENHQTKLTGVETTFDYGQRLTDADIKGLVAEKDTLGTATVSIAPIINIAPEAGKHAQTVTATATFADQSSLSSDPFTVRIRTAADTFTPAISP